ncbi:MAG: polysaccharide transporter [Kofleriaceae bacterium]|nr:MAG: polysaccharide transporter [Kofleriaceae bacterium]MBZ0238225.1 polysaccharide export protein [Kofleriaceae bacterium]
MIPQKLLAVAAALVAVVVTTGLAACGPTIPNYDYSQEPDPRNQEWVLGVGDQIFISVWENPGLTTEATIRPDGTITMPLVGDLRAVGETPSSLKQKIMTKVSTFVKLQGPEAITVALRGANSYRFTVSGEVTRPGMMTPEYFVTVSEALALAGGFTRFAKRNEMVLQRRDAKTGAVRTIPLAYDALSTGKRPDMNIVLMTGDSLFVP